MVRTLVLVTLLLICARISHQCGITTHNVIANRALKWFDHDDYHQIITDNIEAFQAGAAFPDWGYKCIASEFVPNLHEGSELAHWLPFQKKAIEYIREFNRSRTEKNELTAFLFGLISHSVADVLWHDIAYVHQTRQGFINALRYSNCPDYSCGYSPHSISDVGGEFVAAYQVDLSFLKNEWKVPSQDIVNIYKKMGYTFEGGAVTLDVCMGELYSEVEAVSKLPSELLLAYFDEKAPFLLDEYQDWWMGGVNSNALWTTYCWNSTINWLKNGVPDGGKYCFPLTGKQYRYDYAPNKVESTKLIKSILRNVSGITDRITLKKEDLEKESTIRFAPRNLKANSLFGHSIVTCNLTGSHIQYIAIGAPGYDRQKGSVYIYHSDNHHDYYQLTYDTFSNRSGNGDNIKGMPGDRFGYALECVDMNKDGYSDLVVGIPGRNAYPNMDYTGQVRIYYGGIHGLSRNHTDLVGPKKYFNFGSLFSRGDLNGDGSNDLIINVPSGYNRSSPVNYGSGEIWYVLSGEDSKPNVLDIPSKNKEGSWNRMGRSKVFSLGGSRYLITSMPDYSVNSNKTLRSVGKLVCYNITDIYEPHPAWEIVGNFTNGQFSFSFDVDSSSEMLSVSVPTQTVGLINQGVVYTLGIDQLFRGNRQFVIDKLDINSTHYGGTYYARLGYRVKYDRFGQPIASEPYYDGVGRVCVLGGKCVSDQNKHSQYGFDFYPFNDYGKEQMLVGAPRDSTAVEEGGSVLMY